MRNVSINIGDFDERVILYTQERSTRDDFGNYTLDTGTGTERWAQVEYITKSYVVGEGGIEYANQFKITIRKDDSLGLSQGSRVDYDGYELQIVSFNDVGLSTTQFIATITSEYNGATPSGGIGSMQIGSTFIVS